MWTKTQSADCLKINGKRYGSFEKQLNMRNITFVLIGLIFLILWLFIGYPVEINNLAIDRYLMFVIAGIIAGIVFLIYKQITRIKIRQLKIFSMISLVCVSVIYLFIGIWTVFISYDNGPIWEDKQIYTNKKGTIVISQFRRTSGSIYDYRERLIFYKWGNGNRISMEWGKKRMHGIWVVKDLSKDSVYTRNFDEETIKNEP